MRDIGPEQGAALQTFWMVGMLTGSGAPAGGVAEGAVAIGALPVGTSATAVAEATVEALAGGSEVGALVDTVPFSEVAEHESEASSERASSRRIGSMRSQRQRSP